jgi:hypothetical protein
MGYVQIPHIRNIYNIWIYDFRYELLVGSIGNKLVNN